VSATTLGLSAEREPAGTVTLAQALALAEANQPAVRAAGLNVQAVEHRVVQAGLRPNPDLTFEAANFGGRGEVRRFDAAEYTAQIEQPIELGGKRGKRMRLAESERQLSSFDSERVRLDARAETARRFAALLGAQERLALAREAVAMADEFVKAVLARVQAGRISPMEESKARILLAQQKTAADVAQQQLQAARVRLAVMWGTATPEFDRAVGDLPSIPAAPELASLVAHLPANPDLARWTAELDQRKATLAVETAAGTPDVAVAVGIRRFAETDSHAFVAGITVPLPLFNRNQGRIREAAVLVEQAEQQRRAAELEAAASLAEVHQALAAELARIAALTNDVLPRSKAVFDAVQVGYAQGKFGYLDVLDARRTFFDARAEYLESLVSAHQAMAEVDRLVGGTMTAPGKN
jgi:cobalt-zinc-cadmium efflux system outer membrane protein